MPTVSQAHPSIPVFRTKPWNMDFSADYLFDIANTIRADRSLYTFKQAASALLDPNAKIGIIRHDIDINPGAAATLAHLEAGQGIIATYFVIPNSEHYTLSDPSVTLALSQIADAGHEIGLHYNPSARIRSNVTRLSDLEADITKQSRILEQATGQKVKSVSFHEPGTDHPTWMDGPVRLAGLTNAYAGIFMSSSEGALYTTDSAGTWSYGEPISRINHAIDVNARVIQVLTHAEWWDLGPSGTQP